MVRRRSGPPGPRRRRVVHGGSRDARGADSRPGNGGAGEVFLAFLKLGLTSFGGPIAHLGYFRAEFVERRRWLSERAYVDLVALCQFLPGPASSQTGFAIGLMRGGRLGGLAAWLGFTLPSAILMLALRLWRGEYRRLADRRRLAARAEAGRGRHRRAGRPGHGAQLFAPDRPRASIAAAALALMLFAPGSLGQIGAIAVGGACRAGALPRRRRPAADDLAHASVAPRRCSLASASFFVLLALSFVPGRDGALGAVRRLLSLGRAGVRRRPCRAAAAARCRGGAGMGFRQHVPGGLWRGAGRAGTAVHLRRLSRRRRRRAAGRRRRAALSRSSRSSCRACWR